MMHSLHRVGKGLEADVAGESMLGGIGGFMLELEGKTALVFGVASEDSIAWAICEQLAAAGCKLILGFQRRFMSRVFQLKENLDAIEAFYPIDVSTNELTSEFFTEWQAENPGAKADIVIHAIGFYWTGPPFLTFYLVYMIKKNNISVSPYWISAGLCFYRVSLCVLSSTIAPFVPRRNLFLCTSFMF